MKLQLAQNLRLEQQLKMSPQLIQRIEILQLPSMDLKDLIQNELMENEVLELDEQVEKIEKKEKEDKLESNDEENLASDVDLERFSSLADWNESFGSRASRYRDGGEDPKMNAMQNTVSKSLTLQDHLKIQLDLAEGDPELKKMAEEIIYNINERGYLLYSLEEIRIPMENHPPEGGLEEALSLVQSFEPRGVGARDLQECLLLQLDGTHPFHDLMKKIIQYHLEDISKNRLPKVAKETGEPLAKVQDAIEAIAHLDPIPGRIFGTENIPYIQPDVVIELIEDKYEIRLEDDYYPKLGISDYYIRMYRDNKSLDPKLRKHIREKIESAKWLIESIEQRKSTLTRVVHELVKHQKDFLDHGMRFLKPLKMQEVADILGIHVSTVSRALSEKYVQIPRGIFPLKYFFTGATKASDGSVESRVGVKHKVKEIIDNEEKTRPLSDQEIVEKLKVEGLDIARRTVTKYRKALKVPSSRERRIYRDSGEA